MNHDELVAKLRKDWRYRFWEVVLAPVLWAGDIIERARYRRYVKLYLWFDCLPPDEKDIDAVTNSLSKIWGTPEEDEAWKDL